MQTLLSDIEAFVARHGLEESTFGRLVGDRHVVQQLRAGRRMWPETVSRIRERMREIEASRAAGSENETPVSMPPSSAADAATSSGTPAEIAPEQLNEGARP